MKKILLVLSLGISSFGCLQAEDAADFLQETVGQEAQKSVDKALGEKLTDLFKTSELVKEFSRLIKIKCTKQEVSRLKELCQNVLQAYKLGTQQEIASYALACELQSYKEQDALEQYLEQVEKVTGETITLEQAEAIIENGQHYKPVFDEMMAYQEKSRGFLEGVSAGQMGLLMKLDELIVALLGHLG